MKYGFVLGADSSPRNSSSLITQLNIKERTMGSFSMWHWLFVLIVTWAVILVPIVKILNKSGFSGWWSIISLIPLVNIMGLWVFALSKWPNSK